MIKTVASLVVLGLLTACNNPIRPLPAELADRKPACASGDYSTCSDIGHAVRDQSGGSEAYPIAQPPKTYVISQPIID
ncbi:hypothetical protein KBY27_06355 [Ruegeria pomeroyi]|uniref:Lipoprotein n=1 Tax=Ruegeria pomeroyi TaxID=89184 RepID=A0A9Q3WKI6_9RHOB|nr:hypothetical protein [Ruegeria pomeroyi]MCE8518040.1 hypothetical protein [Ruegeria pomeroyi]MCE8537072.1 hypothetical protein [Ruegeria pomeroyi]MCE8555397.1 hypothetical protein [Ruegeria pomeroyi]